jgi:hypothetical protein
MTSREQLLAGLLAVLAAAFIGYIAYSRQLPVSPTPNTTQTPTSTTQQPAPTPTPTLPTSTQNPMIQVSNIADNQQVTSPLQILGRARGNWYFEASFPIRLEDANGTVLGRTIGQAQSDWMTTNFVPFSATLTFTTPTTTTGWLFLQKDNPSGLPANDAEIQIPVTF